MSARTLFIVVYVVVTQVAWSQATAQSTDANTVAQALADAVSTIKSYDVEMDRFALANDESGGVNLAELGSVRDILSVGVGRRLDRPGSEGTAVSVIDWKTVESARNGSISLGLTYGKGFDYFQLYNPNVSGYLLSELATNAGTQRTLLPRENRDGLVCLRLDNDKANGPVKVWIDESRGFMPVVVECYVRTKSGPRPLSGITIDEFAMVGDQLWVPVNGTLDSLTPGKDGGVEKKLRIQVIVDQAKSSWNKQIPSDTFAVASLPVANFENPFGWKEYLPETSLKVAQSMAETRRQITRNRFQSVSPILIVVNVIIVLTVSALLIYRWYSRSRRGRALS